MANQVDGGKQTEGAVGGIDQEHKTLAERSDALDRQPVRPGRDDRLDKELEAERREPGLRTGGAGASGADPASPNGDGNSNT